MIIKAVKFRADGFYTQPFAFGGEEGMDKFDKNIRYRGSLQNYLIDTGDEVILVDTGLPAGTPEESPDENSLAFTGKDIQSYMDAFASLGYKPEQVTKILLTHKHSDHSGELKSFPNAKIYVGADEIGVEELKGIDNLVPVTYTDGLKHSHTPLSPAARCIHCSFSQPVFAVITETYCALGAQTLNHVPCTPSASPGCAPNFL